MALRPLLILFLCSAGLATAQPKALSGGEVMDDSVVQAAGRHLRVRKSSSPNGTIVLIANRSGQPLHVSSSLGMNGTLDTDETTSWPCSADTYFDNFVLEAPDGHLIASPNLACGDTIHIIAED